MWALKRWGWPPDVTRRQSMRDLLLLADMAEQDDDDG